MGNMSYCKFENTYNDLRDVYDDFETASNETEKKYRKLMLKLCKQIVEEYGDVDFDEYDDEEDED